MKMICLIGPDGSGKTTQAEILMERLNRNGIRCSYTWLRFSHILSLPLLAFARLSGLSNGKAHMFWKSPLFSKIYVAVQAADSRIANFFKMNLSNKDVMVCDRFVYDTIVDLAISTKIPIQSLEKKFIPIVPKGTNVILLNTTPEILRKRRPDVKKDTVLDTRIELYNRLADDAKISKIDSSLSVNEIAEKIRRISGI